MFYSFSSNNKLRIILIVSLLLAIFTSIFGIWRKLQKINKEYNEIKNQKIKIEEVNNIKENLEKIKKNKEIIKNINNKLTPTLISNNFLDFVIKLEEIAKKTNLIQQLQVQEKKQKISQHETTNEEKEEMSLSPKTKQEPTQILPSIKEKGQKNPLDEISHFGMSIFLTGNFKNLLSYLIYLENLSYETDYETLTISLANENITALPSNLPPPPEKLSEKKTIFATIEIKVFKTD